MNYENKCAGFRCGWVYVEIEHLFVLKQSNAWNIIHVEILTTENQMSIIIGLSYTKLILYMHLAWDVCD